MMNLQEAKMTDAPKASARKRRYRWSWIVGVFGGALGAIIFNTGRVQDNIPITITGMAMLGIGMLLCAWLYHTSIDEHEKEALYVSNTVGYYTTLVLLLGSLLLNAISAQIVISVQMILLVGTLTGLAAFVWQKYR